MKTVQLPRARVSEEVYYRLECCAKHFELKPSQMLRMIVVSWLDRFEERGAWRYLAHLDGEGTNLYGDAEAADRVRRALLLLEQIDTNDKDEEDTVRP